MARNTRQVRADASIGGACREFAAQLNVGDRYEIWVVDTANDNPRVRADARIGSLRRKANGR